MEANTPHSWQDHFPPVDRSNRPTYNLRYDIPLRALIAEDVDGLVMAGRCISGAFLAHASYRVTGSAVAMGEAAGAVSAIAARDHRLPHEIDWAAAKLVLRRE